MNNENGQSSAPSASRCYATFDAGKSFRLFIAKHGQHHKAARHIDEQVRVLQIGDGFDSNVVKIEYGDGSTDYVPRCWLKIGKGIRSVPIKGRAVRMGKTSLMGSISHGIRTGKAFRGR